MSIKFRKIRYYLLVQWWCVTHF